mgnify:CR=1 FL=1
MSQEHFPDQKLMDEIITGLSQERPSISPKFFYDEIGSHLFEAITFLEEYYPTRTEKQIMLQYDKAIALEIGKCDVLLDLGAGNCEKGSALFNSLIPKEYWALDISKEFLEQAISGLQNFLNKKLNKDLWIIFKNSSWNLEKDLLLSVGNTTLK